MHLGSYKKIHCQVVRLYPSHIISHFRILEEIRRQVRVLQSELTRAERRRLNSPSVLLMQRNIPMNRVPWRCPGGAGGLAICVKPEALWERTGARRATWRFRCLQYSPMVSSTIDFGSPANATPNRNQLCGGSGVTAIATTFLPYSCASPHANIGNRVSTSVSSYGKTNVDSMTNAEIDETLPFADFLWNFNELRIGEAD